VTLALNGMVGSRIRKRKASYLNRTTPPTGDPCNNAALAVSRAVNSVRKTFTVSVNCSTASERPPHHHDPQFDDVRNQEA
jgi:hypothetical protein